MDSEARLTPPRILVVDDESFIRETVEVCLMAEGFHVVAAESGERALDVLEREVIDVAILDISMPGMDGITLLGEIKKLRPDIEVVMASGCGTLESAVQAMRMGAYDYVTKPILNFQDDLVKVVMKAVERRALLASNRRLASDVQEVNSELKHSNVDLKRHLAAFDILAETGRILGDLDGAEPILDLTMETLEHQLYVQRCVLFVESEPGWRACRSIGLGLTGACVTNGLLCSDQLDPKIVKEKDGRALSCLLRDIGVTEEIPSMGVVIPLRARCEVQALLVILEPGLGEPATLNRIRMLSLLAAQVAAPLTLHREQTA